MVFRYMVCFINCVVLAYRGCSTQSTAFKYLSHSTRDKPHGESVRKKMKRGLRNSFRASGKKKMIEKEVYPVLFLATFPFRANTLRQAPSTLSSGHSFLTIQTDSLSHTHKQANKIVPKHPKKIINKVRIYRIFFVNSNK